MTPHSVSRGHDADRDWARGLLEQLGVPPAGRTPARVAELGSVWRRVLEAALVDHLTIPQLAALARFYETPEGAAVMGKLLAFADVVTPALQAAVEAWARAVAVRIRAVAQTNVNEKGVCADGAAP
jgi:hypothetical protein